MTAPEPSGSLRRWCLATATICLLWGLLDNLGHLSVIVRVGAWGAQINSVLAMEFKGFSVLFAMAWVESRLSHGKVRPWHYIGAVVAGAFGGSALYWLLSQRLLSIATQYRGNAQYEAFSSFVLRHGLHGAAICGLAVMLYLARRDALFRQHRLWALQAQSAEAERELTAVQLMAIRSRMEPIDIQQRLLDLETMYERAPESGEQALLQLSQELRTTVDEIATLTTRSR